MANPVDGNFKVVFRGHDGTGAHCELAGFERWEIVDGIHGINRKALEESVCDHRPRSFTVLFGGLENEGHATIEISIAGEILGGTQQHRGVTIVAAGVHLAVIDRTILE